MSPPGATQWPVPQKLPDEELTTYIYTNEVVLLVPLKLAADLASRAARPQSQHLLAGVRRECIPGDATVQATLNVGTETKPSKDAALLQAWQLKLPSAGSGLSARAWWGGAATGKFPPLGPGMELSGAGQEADFSPDASEQL